MAMIFFLKPRVIAGMKSLLIVGSLCFFVMPTTADEPKPHQPPTKTREAKGETVASMAGPTQLVQTLIASEGDQRLLAEELFAKWVQSKMEQAKNAANSNNETQVKECFQEIVDHLSDVLRSSLPAPWMYEALGIAMQGSGYPDSEIRRVMLSSIDFGADITVAMKIARYFELQGMKGEALSIYRDCYRASPAERLPLEAGLRLSLELDNKDGVLWASTGILSQSWADTQLPLIEKAILAAKAAYIRLLNDGRKMEAYSFEQQMKKAQIRDLVVRVAWTGNADIDISVEEPVGSVCNLSNPRTIAGGMLLADGSSLDKPSSDGYSETYACAQGYSGTYRIVIRKIWGEVAGGKVSVHLVSDYGTPDQRVLVKQVPLERDIAIIAEVKNGHREQSLAEVQLQKIQAEKSFTTDAVLEQIGQATPGEQGESDYQKQLAYLQSLNRFASGSANGLRPIPPFARGGVVGYQPIITVIPSGTMLRATAVISGDRRYVRITASPFFSDILAVDTFNFVSGATNNGAGGAGGGGAGGGGFGGGGFGGGGAF